MTDITTASATDAATVASTAVKPDAPVVFSAHALCKVYRSGEVEVHALPIITRSPRDSDAVLGINRREQVQPLQVRRRWRWASDSCAQR